ncbi:hypothetical protein [Pseudomonas sp. DC3000-4b1]|uniref:hypothetical protein n=1 Tax=unclassified Pseudomonas TaxID=196821 RepID=UPI003CF0CFCA
MLTDLGFAEFDQLDDSATGGEGRTWSDGACNCFAMLQNTLRSEALRAFCMMMANEGLF